MFSGVLGVVTFNIESQRIKSQLARFSFLSLLCAAGPE